MGAPGDRRRAAGGGLARRRAARRARRDDRTPPRSGLSSRRRRSGPGRSRSRGEASRSSGTWRGSPGRSPRSSRGPRRSPGPRPSSSTASARLCFALTSESSESGRAGSESSEVQSAAVSRRPRCATSRHDLDLDRPSATRHPRHRRPAATGPRRPSILSRSLISVSSPRATCSASLRRFFGSSTFISS